MNLKIDLKPYISVLIVLCFLASAGGLVVLSLSLWGQVGTTRMQSERYVVENDFIRGILKSTPLTPSAVQLVDPDRLSVVSDAIIRTAQKNKVELGVIKRDLRPLEVKTGYGRVFYNLTATASFKDLGAFFEELRNMPEGLVDVESMSMIMSSDDPKKVNAEILLAVCVSQ